MATCMLQHPLLDMTVAAPEAQDMYHMGMTGLKSHVIVVVTEGIKQQLLITTSHRVYHTGALHAAHQQAHTMLPKQMLGSAKSSIHDHRYET